MVNFSSLKVINLIKLRLLHLEAATTSFQKKSCPEKFGQNLQRICWKEIIFLHKALEKYLDSYFRSHQVYSQ